MDTSFSANSKGPKFLSADVPGLKSSMTNVPTTNESELPISQKVNKLLEKSRSIVSNYHSKAATSLMKISSPVKPTSNNAPSPRNIEKKLPDSPESKKSTIIFNTHNKQAIVQKARESLESLELNKSDKKAKYDQEKRHRSISKLREDMERLDQKTRSLIPSLKNASTANGIEINSFDLKGV